MFLLCVSSKPIMKIRNRGSHWRRSLVSRMMTFGRLLLFSELIFTLHTHLDSAMDSTMDDLSAERNPSTLKKKKRIAVILLVFLFVVKPFQRERELHAQRLLEEWQ